MSSLLGNRFMLMSKATTGTATMTFKVHGQQIAQSGATYTVALRKLAAGWRIRAWAWAKGAQAAHAPR
jgi:hypothetical protein